MRRDAARGLSIVAALVAVGGAVVVSWHLAAIRGAQHARYDREISDQRRSAGRFGADAPSLPPAAATREVCVLGVETFAAAVARTVGGAVFDGRVLDAAALAEVSRVAVVAQRHAEHATGAPGLPQRMGRAVEPTSVACGGKTAYATARVPVGKGP